MTRTPFLLCILDGVGIASPSEGNAVSRANTPTLDRLLKQYPNSTLRTDGAYVGLPDGQMGNSEVGHKTIGAGRVIKQSLQRISDDFNTGTFMSRAGYQSFMEASKDSRAIHLTGLLSDGGVHSHGDHAFEICKLFSEAGRTVFLHGITDGRDTDRMAAKTYISEFSEKIKALKNVHFASLGGRYYLMERDNNWERIEPAWRLLTDCQGQNFPNVQALLEHEYTAKRYDEYILPSTLTMIESGLDPRVLDDDSVFLFNFRADRMRHISGCFLGAATPEFDYKPPRLKAVATMTAYDEKFETYSNLHVIYPNESVNNTLGECVEQAGLSQLRIAESEKYPHVTYFLNRGRDNPY